MKGLVGIAIAVFVGFGVVLALTSGDPKLGHAASCARLHAIEAAYAGIQVVDERGEATPDELAALAELAELADRTADSELRDVLRDTVDRNREVIRTHPTKVTPVDVQLYRRLLVLCPR